MLWFPGTPLVGVQEVILNGLSCGLVMTSTGQQRIWHGDDVTFDSNNLAHITPGPAAAAAEKQLAAAQVA